MMNQLKAVHPKSVMPTSAQARNIGWITRWMGITKTRAMISFPLSTDHLRCLSCVRNPEIFCRTEGIGSIDAMSSVNGYATTTSKEEVDDVERIRVKLQSERDEIIGEMSSITKSLYRACFRSVAVIRQGNAHDEEEFRQREEDREEMLSRRGERGGGNDSSSDARLSMISMLPPVDREMELLSRSEYYQQYTHENFVAGRTDLRAEDSIDDEEISRLLSLINRGEEHRRWLMNDMKFDDPYNGDSCDRDRMDRLQQRALDYTRDYEYVQKSSGISYEEYLHQYQQARASSSPVDSDDDDDSDWSDFSDDEDDRPSRH